MSRSVRVALLLAVTVLACLAVLQAVGRISSANLGDLEPAINEFLVPYGVSIEGATGGWNRLNPTVTTHRVTFAGGRLNEVFFEVDFLKSLLNARVVLSRLVIGSGYVGLEHRDSGWRLRGSAGKREPAVGIFRFLVDIDELRASFELEGFRYGKSTSFVTAASAFIFEGRRRISLTLEPGESCARCEGHLELDFNETFWGSSGSDGYGSIRLTDFVVDGEAAEIFGLPAGKLNVIGGSTKNPKERRFSAEASFEGGRDNHSRVVASANLSGSVDKGGYHGVVDNVRVDSIDGRVELSPFRLVTNARDTIELFGSAIDLGRLSTFVARIYGLDHRVGLLVKELDPRGHLIKAVFRVDPQGTAFASRIDRLSINSHLGLPGLQDISGSIGGHGNVMRLDLDSESAAINLPNVFDGPLLFGKATGRIFFWFGRDHLGIRGDKLRFRTHEGRVVGSLGLSMPAQYRSEHQTTLFANVEEMTVRSAKEYLPNSLSKGIKSWISRSLRDDGSVSDVRLVYQGRNVTQRGLPVRRAELKADFDSVALEYHQDWPLVSDARGTLEVAGQEIRVDLQKATIFDTEIAKAEIAIPSNGSRVDINVEVRLPVAEALLFAQETPIQLMVPAINGDFVGEGSVGIDASIRVPLTHSAKNLENVTLKFEFYDAGVSLEDLGIRFDALNGSLEYRAPYSVVKSDLSANLFDTPVDIEFISGIDAKEEFVRLALFGQLAAIDFLELIDATKTSFVAGTLEYYANVSIFPDSTRPTELSFTSDMSGVELTLPDEWAKSQSLVRPLDVSIQFLDSYTSLAFRHGGTAGWFHLYDNQIRRGSVGVGVPAVIVSDDEEGVVISGGLETLGLFELDASIANSKSTIPWRLNNFRIDRLRFGELDITNTTVSGGSVGDALRLQLYSDQVDAVVGREIGGPWVVDVDEIRIPRFSDLGAAASSDILSFGLVADVGPIDVTVENLLITDIDGSLEEYGRWRFRLRPHPDGIQVLGLDGAIRGIEISSSQEMLWSRSTNRTYFEGRIQGVALRSVLSQWGFDLNMEAESFVGKGSIDWPGSPLAFDVDKVVGRIDSEINNGRIVDIEQGGGVARILGLLNYSAIARRLSGNFSDIVSKGVSFNRIHAGVNLRSGILEFSEPMFVEGNGLLFRVNGTVDLTDGALDNELIVTLPVSDSLPWYAAYIAIANPAAGVGVLLGRRIFGAQIENLSSGKYQISGTLNDPQVEFLSIFTTDMSTSIPSEPRIEQNHQ